MMRKKIAFILTSFDIGGAERQFWYLIDNINPDEYEAHVLLVSHPGSRPDIESHQTAKITRFEMRNKFDLRIVLSLARYIRRNEVHLIQSQLFMDNQIARLTGLISRRPVVTSVRGELILRGWLDRLELGLQRLSSRIVVNSHWLKGTLVSKGIGSKKIVVIHNGLDSSRFHCSIDAALLRRKFNIPVNAQVVGIVARLDPLKDHRTFFDVIRLVSDVAPDVFAVVAGDGALREELERYVEEIGIAGRVLFFGSVGDELGEIFRVMDVFLLTSRSESLPNVLLESASAGVPIVASDTHGVPEIVQDGANGYLANVGDSRRMAEAVLDILSDPGLKSRFIDKGYETVNKFSIDAMVKKYEDLYSELFPACTA